MSDIQWVACILDDNVHHQASPRVTMDDSLVKRLILRIRSEKVAESWFDEVQTALFVTLQEADLFLPAFRRYFPFCFLSFLRPLQYKHVIFHGGKNAWIDWLIDWLCAGLDGTYNCWQSWTCWKMWPGRTRRTPNLWMTSVSTHLSTSVVGAHCMIWLMALSTSFCTSICISIALTYSSSYSCMLLVCCISSVFVLILYHICFSVLLLLLSLLWLLSEHLLWIIIVNSELCLLFTVSKYQLTWACQPWIFFSPLLS